MRLNFLGRLKAALSKIKMYLMDYWPNILVLLGGVGLTFSGIWTILKLQKEYWLYSGTGIIFLISTVLFSIGTIKLWHQTLTIRTLQSLIVRQENVLLRVRQDYFATFDKQLGNLYDELQFTDTERISLYRHTDGKFLMIGRYSKNHDYCQRGRVIYPDSEGCIGKAWNKGRAFENNAPNPLKDEDQYVNYMKSKWKMNENVVRSLTMKSRNLSAYALDNFQSPSRRVAVIVFESLKTNKINESSLDRVILSDNLKNICRLLETMSPLEPSLKKARDEGY